MSTVTETTSNTTPRRHDLDALRAIAMLLGIVLHAALSFAPIPWTVQDSQQGNGYYVLFAAIHGFRMPLFFLISGFFTAMLWRKRGLGGLVAQRGKRILLPLVVGCFTIIPAMWAVSFLAAAPSSSDSKTEFFDAVSAGDVEKVSAAIESESLAIDAQHPAAGSTLLTVATFSGQTEMVEMLLEKGADVHQKNNDGGTALHAAIFMGRAGDAKLLLDAGADPDAKDGNGQTPRDNIKVDFGTTNYIAQMFGQSIDEETLADGRAEIAEMLGEDQAQTNLDGTASNASAMLYGLLFQLPLFMHLWFLAFLCWLIIGFAGYSVIARLINFGRIPKWLLSSPLAFIYLVPLTMIPQHFMMQGAFGPDASIGLLPIPSVLGYYAIFFFFGAIYWDVNDENGMLGRWWYITLPVALFVIFPIGLEFVSGTFGFVSGESFGSSRAILGNLLQAVFAWMMIFGSIGMFRALLSQESKTMRYISDSSYWLYLAHLPLVILAQWFVKDWPIPASLKFIGITVVVSAFLLLTYEYLVRYTFIGTMLNGKKVRNQTQTI